ncbi:hypothetical protein HZ326_1510 [Fusarium oxysporum f. sp. albedinis]|nr:hypothetical protein HZ326_1510 [Fusarium oxysporum f. sp. albedinis]
MLGFCLVSWHRRVRRHQPLFSWPNARKERVKKKASAGGSCQGDRCTVQHVTWFYGNPVPKHVTCGISLGLMAPDQSWVPSRGINWFYVGNNLHPWLHDFHFDRHVSSTLFFPCIYQQ